MTCSEPDVPVPLALPTWAEVPPSAHTIFAAAGPGGHPKLGAPALPSSWHPLPSPALSRGAVPSCTPERRGGGAWSRLLYYNKAEQTSK